MEQLNLTDNYLWFFHNVITSLERKSCNDDYVSRKDFLNKMSEYHAWIQNSKAQQYGGERTLLYIIYSELPIVNFVDP